MLPPFWRNQYSKSNLGAVLLGLCLSINSFSQTEPLQTPEKVEYPGIIQTFEKLIQIDVEKFDKRSDFLVKNSKTFEGSASVTSLDLEPDFLNSVILHSDPGYIKLASAEKCRFYDTILTDLLRSKEGKIRNIFVTFLNKNSERQSALISRKDFLNKVVSIECPETQKLINEFQIKTLSSTLNSINFDIPNSKTQCEDVYSGWLNNSRTPYLCQIHEYLKDARLGTGDSGDLQQRRAITKVIDQKMNTVQKEYIRNLCENLDSEELFCQEFLNASFWNKIANGFENKIYIEDICKLAINSQILSDSQIKECLSRVRKENDLCLYSGGTSRGLQPQMNCDSLSLALNHSSLHSNYRDCPSNSDQLAITNVSRILLNYSKEAPKDFEGACSSVSAGEFIAFNQRFDNEETWKLQACFMDPGLQREICHKTFFGNYNNRPEAYPNVVTEIIKKVKRTDNSLRCRMVESEQYNPLLLDFKIGCFIVYEKNNCFISECKHKIIYNEQTLNLVTIKNRATVDYFPNSMEGERFSQQFLLTRDFKKSGRNLSNLTSISNFFKKNKTGIIHGIGCAEDLLPSFFKSRNLNQCSPLPFIIDGMIKQNDKTVFITRTAVDSIVAPRFISWSNIYSGVKSYQLLQPLKQWTIYGLD